ncbi:MAG: hypothetical protein K0U74_01835 [Alphaproteobacteria bacterium]|nr:hypothetical protein [Alphaproteobacteria bacterium]
MRINQARLTNAQFIACVYGFMATASAITAVFVRWYGESYLGLPVELCEGIAFGFAILAAANILALFIVEAFSRALRRLESD